MLSCLMSLLQDLIQKHGGYEKILINIRNQNRIIILSTHILQFAADLCDEILFINNGNIIHTEKN